MEKETSIQLQIYYGTLLQQLKNTYDYFEKQRIEKKIKSIECLLDIDYFV